MKDSSYVPGIGFKFFRSHVPSANFVAMHFLSTWDTFNWFKYPLTNHLSEKNLPAAQQLLAKKFGTVSDWATFVGLSDFASFTEDGTKEENPVFPYQLVFEPNRDLTAKYTDEFQKSYIDMFENDIKKGTELYTIIAIPGPDEPSVVIGTVVTTSDFTASVYGDTKMFLKHQVFEEDLKLRPEWVKACPKLDSCAICPIEVPCK